MLTAENALGKKERERKRDPSTEFLGVRLARLETNLLGSERPKPR